MAEKGKKATKGTPKKEMKKASAPNFDAMHKLFNKVQTAMLKLKVSLAITKNAHGAIQVWRDGPPKTLLFSARKDGKVLVSSPLYEGKGKSRVRVYKCGGSKWDDKSQVPFDKVTYDMLLARAKDAKTAEDYHNLVYPGKKHDQSGLALKAAAAKARAEKLTKEAKGKKSSAKKTAAIARSAKKGTKKPTKTGRRAITKTAKATA